MCRPDRFCEGLTPADLAFIAVDIFEGKYKGSALNEVTRSVAEHAMTDSGTRALVAAFGTDANAGTLGRAAAELVEEPCLLGNLRIARAIASHPNVGRETLHLLSTQGPRKARRMARRRLRRMCRSEGE